MLDVKFLTFVADVLVAAGAPVDGTVGGTEVEGGI